MFGEPAPTSAEDLEAIEAIEAIASDRRRARGLRVAARRALALARRYRDEEGPRGEREAACVKQALAWRAGARDLRSAKVGAEGPGLTRTRGRRPEAGRRAG